MSARKKSSKEKGATAKVLKALQDEATLTQILSIQAVCGMLSWVAEFSARSDRYRSRRILPINWDANKREPKN